MFVRSFTTEPVLLGNEPTSHKVRVRRDDLIRRKSSLRRIASGLAVFGVKKCEEKNYKRGRVSYRNLEVVEQGQFKMETKDTSKAGGQPADNAENMGDTDTSIDSGKIKTCSADGKSDVGTSETVDTEVIQTVTTEEDASMVRQAPASQSAEKMSNDSQSAIIQSAQKDTETSSILRQPTPPEIKPLTDEEADEKFEEVKIKMNSYLEILNAVCIESQPADADKQEQLVTNEQRAAVFELQRLYFVMKAARLPKIVDYRRYIGDEIAKSGVISKLCVIIMKTFDYGFLDSDNEAIPGLFKPLKCAFAILVNFSDRGHETAVKVSEYPGFLEFLTDKLKGSKEADMNETLNEVETNFIKSMFSVFHNLSMKDNDDIDNRMRDIGVVNICLDYLNSPNEKLVISAAATLADIVLEKDCDILNQNQSAISGMIARLKKCFSEPTHKHIGWTTFEIARGLRQLARNDGNKKVIVSLGSLPVLHDLCKSTVYPEEQYEATNAVWALSFDDSNKDDIIKCDGLMDTIVELKHSTYDGVRKACNGIIWNMREHLKQIPKYEHIVKLYFNDESAAKKDGQPSTGKEKQKGHVMISYQWANQALLLQIRDQLKLNNYPVWMDVDDMGGSTLQAMALAIENADVVIMCMTKKYKDSPNCRAEAEYAFSKRKNIIPCIMERGYRPDGWLGMILGAKLFYDFSGKYKYEDKLMELLKELSVVYNKKEIEPPIVKAIAVEQNKAPTVSKPLDEKKEEEISKWTENEVVEWAEKHRVKSQSAKNLSGEELVFLRTVRHEAPEAYYMMLRTSLNISDIGSIMMLTKALEKL